MKECFNYLLQHKKTILKLSNLKQPIFYCFTHSSRLSWSCLRSFLKLRRCYPDVGVGTICRLSQNAGMAGLSLFSCFSIGLRASPLHMFSPNGFSSMVARLLQMDFAKGEASKLFKSVGPEVAQHNFVTFYWSSSHRANLDSKEREGDTKLMAVFNPP